MKKVLKITGRTVLVLIGLTLLFLLGIFVYHRVMLKKEKQHLYPSLWGKWSKLTAERCAFILRAAAHTLVFMSGYGTPSPILDFKPLYKKLTDDHRIAGLDIAVPGNRETDSIFADKAMRVLVNSGLFALSMPTDPDRYFQVYREFTGNKQEYIELDCGHYVHVEGPDFIAEQIRLFEDRLDER